MTQDLALTVSVEELVPVDARTQLDAIQERVAGLDVHNDDTAGVATESIVLATRTIKCLDDERKNITDPLEKRKKAIIKAFDSYLDPLKAIKDDLTRKLGRYRQVQLDAAAKAEAERQKKLREAEALRLKIEAETKAKQLEEWEEEKRQAEAEGKTAPAVPLDIPTTVIVDLPEAVVPPPERFTSISGGVRFTKIWDCEVTDLRVLMQAVLDGKAPIACVQANTVFIGKIVRAEKKDLGWPGVRCFEKDSARTS